MQEIQAKRKVGGKHNRKFERRSRNRQPHSAASSFRLCGFHRKNHKETIPAHKNMDFFNSAVDVLQTLVIALGAGLGIWGVINLLEGYGNDNPGAKSQGMKQLMAGGGVALIGMILVPLLKGLFG